MNLSIKKRDPYTTLAEIYDSVMQDVDYETWADYIDEIIMHHHPEARDLLELACGTGTMALSLEELGFFNITATDGAPEMVKAAQKKGNKVNSEVDFQVVDFLDIRLDKKFDVVFMVFDSVNYLHKKEEIEQLFSQVSSVLKNKVFLFLILLLLETHDKLLKCSTTTQEESMPLHDFIAKVPIMQKREYTQIVFILK